MSAEIEQRKREIRKMYLYPLPKQKLHDLNFAFGDTEAYSLSDGRFYCAAISTLTSKTASLFLDRAKFFDALWQYEVIYFYNLGYDIQFILNESLNRDNITFQFIGNKGRLLGVILKKETVYGPITVILKDIMPFAGGDQGISLEDSCHEYHVAEQKIHVDFAHPDYPLLELHNQQDTIMLRDLFVAMRAAWWDTHEIDIAARNTYSVAGYSIKCWRKQLKRPLFNSFLTLVAQDRFCRLTYKGGYCNTHSLRPNFDIPLYDCVSMYPFASQAIRFPLGRGEWTREFLYWDFCCRKIPGVARVVMHSAKLSRNCIISGGKLVRASGTYFGVFTSLGIFAALADGERMIKFEKGLVFHQWDTQNSLAKHERHCLKLKAKFSGNKGKRSAAKLVGNSTTGKCGEKHLQDQIEISLVDPGETCDFLECENGKTIYFTRVTETHNAPYQFVLWVSLLIEFSRLYLFKMADQTLSAYEDTDSLFPRKITEEFQNHIIKSEKFPYQNVGYFELKHTYTAARFLAPKCYCTIDSEFKFGVTIAGVPKKLRNFALAQKMFQGEPKFFSEPYLKIMGMKEALRAIHYSSRDGPFGGLRRMQKERRPAPKPDNSLLDFALPLEVKYLSNIHWTFTPIDPVEEKAQKRYGRASRKAHKEQIAEMEENFDDFDRQIHDPSLTNPENKQLENDWWKQFRL